MEVDHGAGVLRCPYCRREVLMPAPQAARTGWPVGPGGAGMPNITISTARTFTQTPEAIRRQKLMVLIYAVGAVLAMGTMLVLMFSSMFSDSGGDFLGSSDKVEEVAVGTTARVNSFEATVRSVDCSKKAITKPDDPSTPYDDTATQKAKGKFCVVSFSAKNVGEKTDTYPTLSLKATSPTERVLYSDVVAEDYANKGSSLKEPIDPGKTVDQLLVFEVPSDTTLAYLQISDSYSAGSTIKVKVGP
ncbi:DUF4352 domain-containing protein [Couchioplanes azureus]|uniref:DUF4352 domain-containing protein n=1 Tax=Couchioplanes caeruleus TaxID=56438 RepID=UPI0016711F4D|nr:DUF4352 domain-containing protein [Couchioplanes caeruleus]GGQ78138.1 hypothetical protein GCM10010166_55280 [Couchioplanes caeruleus subsp. azureus]